MYTLFLFVCYNENIGEENMKFKDFWDNAQATYSTNGEEYSSWLDKYAERFSMCETKVLDLGCGIGYDSEYLTKKGLEVIAGDFSEVALRRLRERVPNVKTIILDISEPLPFEDSSFDLIIADLSLHYFDEKTTGKIMGEIKRILTSRGCLLARVNSIYDVNHGAGDGEKLEENYYFVGGYNKRFFTLVDAKKFFSIIGKVEANEENMSRYNKPKMVIEVEAEKQ